MIKEKTMLLQDMQNALVEIKTIHQAETDAASIDYQNSVDQSFSELVNDVATIVKQVHNIGRISQFTPADIKEKLLLVLDRLEKEARDKVVTNKGVNNGRKECADILEDLKKAWKLHYTEHTESIVSTLDLIKGLNSTETSKLLMYISRAANWGEKDEVYSEMENALKQAEALIDDMNLEEDVVSFLRRLGDKNATISDLTPRISEWIYHENLQDKIRLSL